MDSRPSFRGILERLWKWPHKAFLVMGGGGHVRRATSTLSWGCVWENGGAYRARECRGALRREKGCQILDILLSFSFESEREVKTSMVLN